MVLPTAKVEVVNFALPPLRFAVPSTVFPAVNVTGPVGMNVGDVMVAVNVTTSPELDGFGDEVSVAALVAWVMTWFTTLEVLPRLLASPT